MSISGQCIVRFSHLKKQVNCLILLGVEVLHLSSRNFVKKRGSFQLSNNEKHRFNLGLLGFHENTTTPLKPTNGWFVSSKTTLQMESLEPIGSGSSCGMKRPWEKVGVQFQPSIFRCELLVSGRVLLDCCCFWLGPSKFQLQLLGLVRFILTTSGESRFSFKLPDRLRRGSCLASESCYSNGEINRKILS